MSPRTLRLRKEARMLFWPWCVVSLIGAIPLLDSALDSRVADLTLFRNLRNGSWEIFLFGIVFLASLSLGSEFQHRTLPILLTQPVSRIKILNEKLTVSFAATACVTPILFAAFWRDIREDHQLLYMLAGVLIAANASATLWALVARSVIGSFILNLSALGLAPLTFGVILTDLFGGPRRSWFDFTFKNPSLFESMVSITTLCYAALSFWLGRRMLARFEATGSNAGDDFLAAGPIRMPEAVTAFFRCRPGQPLLNLIRKEVRLLRPLWLLTLFAILGLVFLAPFNPKVPDANEDMSWAFVLMMGYLWLATVLAGTLSVGEERASGTQSSQMTLPLSVRRQWLVKLSVAIASGFAGSALVLAVGGILGLFDAPNSPPALQVAFVSLLCTAAAFWCACTVSGTVRAVLLFYPLVATLGIVGLSGIYLAFITATAGGLMDLIVSMLHPYPFHVAAINNPQLLIPELLFALITIFMIIHSYRLFRTESPDNVQVVLRRLAPMGLAALLCGFSLSVFLQFLFRPADQASLVMRETHESIGKLIDGTTLDASRPTPVRIEEITRVSSLSDISRRWLKNSTITIAPNTVKTPRPTYVKTSAYITTVQLASGWTCLGYGGGFWDCRGPDGGRLGNYPLAGIHRVSPK